MNDSEHAQSAAQEAEPKDDSEHAQSAAQEAENRRHGPLRMRRAAWRHAFTPARHPGTEGWELRGPGGRVLASIVETALTPGSRMRGLLGRSDIPPGTALLLAPCSQVHTIGMRFAIDAVFCDSKLRVLSVQTLSPGRLSRPVRGAGCCIELPSGAAEGAGLVAGTPLEFVRRTPGQA